MKVTDRSRATAFGSIPNDLTDESGAFPIGEGRRAPTEAEAAALAAMQELAPEAVSLIPEPPRESLRPRAKSVPVSGERAQLVIEDLTLRPDNPYLASSLVPPPESPSRKRNVALIAAGMLSAVAVGALIELIVLRAHVAPAVEAPRAAAPVNAAAPAKPVIVAESAEPAAPTAVAVAPVVVEPERVVPAVSTAVVAPAETEALRPSQVKLVPLALPAPPEPVAAVEVAPAAAAAEKLPVQERLTREQVAAGFDALRPSLEQCAQGGHGLVEIDAAIASTGRVAHAVIAGTFVGTPEGSCMARAVRSARFPESAQERLNVRYPITL
jgi:hypothetical protein